MRGLLAVMYDDQKDRLALCVEEVDGVRYVAALCDSFGEVLQKIEAEVKLHKNIKDGIYVSGQALAYMEKH